MMAGITATNLGCETVILEKMDRCGRKIRITGKGRCNVTNACDMEDFINNIPGNGRFLYSAFKSFTNQDIVKLLKSEGVDTKVERGNRVFPITDNSQSIIDAFINKLKRLKVKIVTNAKATDIIVEGKRAIGVKYKINEKEENIFADKVILATGGMSYKATGSTRRWI